MLPNKAEFRCTFHHEPARGRVTFEDDGTFYVVFHIGKVAFPFKGVWSQLGTRVMLETPHGFAKVMAYLNQDNSLTVVNRSGGFADLDIVGVRTTPLQHRLVRRIGANV